MKTRYQLLVLSLFVLLLAACGSAPQKSSGTKPAVSSAATPAGHPGGQPAPVLPGAGSGRGAYYKDDGPGENPPAGLELTLDAEPKVEPYSASGNKAYVVFGKTYTPMLDNQPFSQRGIGSWYGKKFHGQKTSSGELYDMYKMTAAHPTLPIPSYARITNISNGRQVIVRINDRGPFHTNRIVDLSFTAALKLDYLGKGSSELLLERLLPADIEKMAENKKNSKPATLIAPAPAPASASVLASAPISAPAVIETMPVAPMATALLTPLSVAASAPTSAAASVTAAATTTAVAVSNAPDPTVLAAMVAGNTSTESQVAVTKPHMAMTAVPVPSVISTPNPASGFYLQFGAFGLRANAEATFTHLQSKLAQLPAFEIVQQGTLYRLFSGPFATRDEANDAIQLALRIGVVKPIIVQR